MVERKANTTKIVSKANSYLVLDTIKTHGLVTVEGILKNTGLSRPTVLKIIKEFTERRLVKKAGFGENEVGRSPVLYSLNTDEYFAMGIDIDGPPVYVAVSDLNGKLLYSDKFELDIDSSIAEIKDAITARIELALKVLKIKSSNIIGIGLGLPASVDISKNCAVMASRLQALISQPIADLIAEQVGIPVLVRNDAHLIGIAEIKKLTDINDILCIAHRTGIGLAIILDGKIYSGSSGNSGFIGHLTVDENGRKCACGKNGCLEALSSKRAIKELYFEQTGQQLGYRQILARAADNDEAAVEICKEAGRYFGIGLANIVKTLDIKTIVISDIRCDETHVFVRSINKSLKNYLEPFFNKPAKLLVGALSEDELALGGCHYVIDDFFVSPELILKA